MTFTTSTCTFPTPQNDSANLPSKSGEYKPVKGKEYRGINAKTAGNAFKQEAVSLPPPLQNLANFQNFASDNVILAGITGNDSTVTFEGIEGTGKPQWVSFYYQSTPPRTPRLPR